MLLKVFAVVAALLIAGFLLLYALAITPRGMRFRLGRALRICRQLQCDRRRHLLENEGDDGINEMVREFILDEYDPRIARMKAKIAKLKAQLREDRQPRPLAPA